MVSYKKILKLELCEQNFLYLWKNDKLYLKITLYFFLSSFFSLRDTKIVKMNVQI